MSILPDDAEYLITNPIMDGQGKRMDMGTKGIMDGNLKDGCTKRKTLGIIRPPICFNNQLTNTFLTEGNTLYWVTINIRRKSKLDKNLNLIIFFRQMKAPGMVY